MPMYIFFSWLLAVLVVTSALYTMLSVRHFLASGQLAGFLASGQLHIGVSFFVGVGIAIGIADCITLAASWRSFCVSVEYFTTMFTDEIFHVCHTTVTNTDCVAVEKFVQFV